MASPTSPARPLRPSPKSISFIIPTIGRDTLPRLIDQLKSDTLPIDEIILVADGPSETAATYQNDPRIRFFIHHGPSRGNLQRDFGISHATGDFLMFADDDDLFIPDTIKSIIHPALAAKPKIPHVFRIPGIRRPDPAYYWLYSGAGVAIPNRPKALSTWFHDPDALNCPCKSPQCEHHFIQRTTANFPPAKIHDRCVYLVRPGTPWLAYHLSRYWGCPYHRPDYCRPLMKLAAQRDYDTLNAMLDAL